jgi:hypothetical protein
MGPDPSLLLYRMFLRKTAYTFAKHALANLMARRKINPLAMQKTQSFLALTLLHDIRIYTYMT